MACSVCQNILLIGHLIKWTTFQLYCSRFIAAVSELSVSSRPGMQDAVRIGLVPEQTTSVTRLSAALPFFPDAPHYFTSNDMLQLMLTDTAYLRL